MGFYKNIKLIVKYYSFSITSIIRIFEIKYLNITNIEGVKY